MAKTIPVPKNDTDLIKYWSAEMIKGDAFRRKIYHDHDWRRFQDYFRQKFPGVNPQDHDTGSANRLRIKTESVMTREARKMVPKIVYTAPYLKVSPLSGNLATQARVLERVINGIISKIDLESELKKACLSAIQCGTSFLKTGYDAEYAPVYKDILTTGRSDILFDEKGTRREFRDNIYPGMPWSVWIHPKNVVFPEMTCDFRESPWVAFRYFRHIDDVKSDPRLSNTKDIEPRGYRFSEIDSSLQSADMFANYPLTQDWILLTEIRDKRTGRMYIFAEDHGKVLYKERDVLMEVIGAKLPIHPLVFNFNTDWGWGTSDIHLVEEELKELMDLRTQHIKTRRLQVAKFLYNPAMIDENEVKRLTMSDVGAGLKAKGNLDQAIKEISFGNVNGDIIMEENDLERRIKTQFGSAAFDTFAQSRRGGAEITGAQQDATMPVSERQLILRKLVVNIAKDIANMIFNFWTDDTVVDVLSPITEEVMGPDGMPITQDVTKQVWVQFKGKDLRGDFDYIVTPTSGKFQDTSQAKQEAFEILNFFSKAPGVNMQELVRQLAPRFEGIDADKLFNPINSPQQPMSMNELIQKEVGFPSRQQPQQI